MNATRLKKVLLTITNNTNRNSMITVDTLIDMTPKLTKKNRTNKESFETTFPTHTKLFKLSRRYGQSLIDYYANIDRKLNKKELTSGNNSSSSMEKEGRKWGKRIGSSSIIEHKNTFYLEIFPSENANESKHVYLWEDGTELNTREVDNMKKNFLPVKSSSKKQKDAGLDKGEQLIVNNIKLTNIIRFKGYGEKWKKLEK